MSSFLDFLVAFSLAALLIVGGYQVYFLPQKHALRKPRSLLLGVDNRIPFRPKWVWIYSLLYYPFIVSTIVTITTFRQFAYVSANFLILLVAQVTIAFFFPVKAPDRWRKYDPDNSLSEKFLSVVHSFDKGGNCFPSMHIAVAMLSSLHLLYNLLGQYGPVAYCVFLLPALIAMSALFTKQHFLLDIPAGCALAVAVFSLHPIMYA